MARDFKDSLLKRGDYVLLTRHWKGSGLDYSLVVGTTSSYAYIINDRFSWVEEIRKPEKFLFKIDKDNIPEDMLLGIRNNLSDLISRPHWYRRHMGSMEDYDV